MRAERGTSQILFGLLPTQTADLEGGLWRVQRWADPVTIPIDQITVRESLMQSVAPWQTNANDNGFYGYLRSQSQIQVLGVNEDRGVVVEPFPVNGVADSATLS